MTIADATATSGAAPESIGTRVARDFEGAAGLGLVYLGDRLGLFAALREGGPATADELAGRTGLVERYVREWLAGVAAAGYAAYAADTQRFDLTEEQAALFADPDNALFVGATAQFLLPVLDQADAALRGTRRALKPTGACLTLDPRAADTLEGNLTAEGKFLYWASIFYCMTVLLAQGGLGLGTAMGEGQARALATEAGFTRIRRVPIGEDAEMLLELKP